MSNAAPPAWVRELSLPSGAWRCLVGLWGFAKYGAAAPAQVWPARDTLAAATGQKPATVAKQLRKLADLRWILRAPNGVLWLAWRIPWSSGRIPWSSDTPVVKPTTTVTWPDTPVVASRRPQSSHNLQEPSKEHSSNGVEARDLDRDGITAAIEAAPTPPPKRSSNMVVSGKPRSRNTRPPVAGPGSSDGDGRRKRAQLELERQQRAESREHSAVLDPVDPRSVPGSSPVDPWPGRVREASESAHYHLAMSVGPAPSYGGLLEQARANYGDERVLEALRAWESDLPGHRPRPPANKLWWRTWTSWVESVLGVEPPARTRPGHRPRLSCVPPSNTDITLLRTPGQEKWELLAAQERADEARGAS